MSTSCFIARPSKDNKKIEVNRINFDGYPSYVGYKLENFFNTPEKIDGLFVKKEISEITNDNSIEFYPGEFELSYPDFSVLMDRMEKAGIDYCYFFKDKWYQVPMIFDLQEIPSLQKGHLYPIGTWGS